MTQGSTTCPLCGTQAEVSSRGNLRDHLTSARQAPCPAAAPVPMKTADDETGEELATVRAERDEAITLAATQLPRVWRSAANMARELVRDGQSAEEIARKLDRMAAVVERNADGSWIA